MSIICERLQVKYRDNEENPNIKNNFFSHSSNKVSLGELQRFLFSPSKERREVINKAKQESSKKL